MFVIFTDTDTDITPKKAQEFGYNLISMPYYIGEKEVYPYVDFDEFDSKAFYDSLRKGVMPKTSGLSAETYKNYFEPFFKEGKDVLYVHFSRAMSGTFNALNVAQSELKEKYPERTLYLIDTKGITIGSYNIVCEIGEMYKAGKSVDEILEWAKTEVDKFAIYFFADNLTFFKRSGRVKGIAAVMGNLIGIRPVIYMGSDGMMKSVSKARGRKGVMDKIMEYVETLQDDITAHRIVIGHSDCFETAKVLGERIKARFGENIRLEFVVVNPTAGSHCGPDGVGISFHAKHR